MKKRAVFFLFFLSVKGGADISDYCTHKMIMIRVCAGEAEFEYRQEWYWIPKRTLDIDSAFEKESDSMYETQPDIRKPIASNEDSFNYLEYRCWEDSHIVESMKRREDEVKISQNKENTVTYDRRELFEDLSKSLEVNDKEGSLNVDKDVYVHVATENGSTRERRDINVDYACFDGPLSDVSYATSIGYRPYQEDAYLTDHFELKYDGKIHQFKLSAIFDGHGGNQASLHCKNKFKDFFVKRLLSFCGKDLTVGGIWNALKVSCVDLSLTVPGGDVAGSCANIILILNDEVAFVANVGDSRSIYIKENGIPVLMTVDQKAIGGTENRYIRSCHKRGGNAWCGRVNGILNVARSIGDHYLFGEISSRPAITYYLLKELGSGYFVQMSDGLTDKLNTNEIAAAIQAILKHYSNGTDEQKMNAISAGLIKIALKLGTKDNTTVLVRQVKP